MNEIEYNQIHYFDSTETTNHYSINTKLNTFLDSRKANNFSQINYSILIHNDKKSILPTLKSRCLIFKINLINDYDNFNKLNDF